MNFLKTLVAASVAGAMMVGAVSAQEDSLRPREYGIHFGVLQPGENNAITDVPGVLVGQVNVHDAKKGAQTGVTAILPHGGNLFKEKVPAGIFLANGFGKMTGYPQVKELGNIETPIVLVNTLNVAAGLDGIIDYTFSFKENDNCRSVNGVVGETNDGTINDIRASSRKLPASMGGYTVGVLVQTNFGGFLNVDGVAVGEKLGGYPWQKEIECADGSIMMVVGTDAPIDSRNLERVAKRAFMGLAKAGGIASNGSGDFAIAFSTAKKLDKLTSVNVANDDMTPIFMATIEATEEAIVNSLFKAHDVTTYKGKVIKALPVDKVLDMLRAENKLPVAK